MKLLILTALIAAVTSSSLNKSSSWPWQVGKEYVYSVDSYTWTKFEQSNSHGNALKTQFIIRVLAPGHLVAKLQVPLYGQLNGQMNINSVPNLKYQPIENINHPFEIFVDGGRVLSLKFPMEFPISYENILKGLISTLQVDLTSFGSIPSFPNSYDDETFQGLFKKMETDVTGDCETLYSVSPVSAEWHRELPDFAEDPIEITKSKNYGICKKRVAYNFGVPEGAVWQGIATENDERQFIKHTSESRMLIGKQGTIYKSETMSSVLVSPLLFGKQKSEVYSYVSFNLIEINQKNSSAWEKSTEYRTVDSLLFTYKEGMFLQFDKQNVVNAQKLLQEITPMLVNPNKLPSSDFLAKFNNLIRILNLMNPEQLTQMTNSIEVAKSSKNIAKSNMWTIYRDAVAQTGTIAAFKEIKSWILTKKIQREKAAEVITSMSSILRYHTKYVMNEFFELAMNPEVRAQNFLNTTALLAATKFIRFGNDEEVVLLTVTQLSKELREAIEKSDSTTAQVYVRALGNLAHPHILAAFAPYLEGKFTVTKYLRVQMVISLKTLANTKDEHVRAVLFSILRNTAEDYEVRVAAALNIFLTYPSTDMMKILAWMSSQDPSTQVRAVLANSIKFAAGLKDPRFAKLAKTAQFVMYLIPKEKFGYRYSTNSMIDEYTSNDEIAHFREMSFIGSENNLLPVYQRGALRFRSTGWTEEDWFTLSVSDMQHFMDYVTRKFYESRKSNSNTEFKFSAKKIAEILNMKPKHRCDLEGAFFLDNWNQQTLITFNEDDLNNLLMGYSKQIHNGLETHFTKLLNSKHVLVIFPLATGMPFVLEYSEPMALIVKSKVQMGKSKNLILNSEVQLTYARNLDGRAGFLDTIRDEYANAGVISKLQFYIPAKFNVDWKSGQLRVELPEQDSNLIHMSVWPYTTVQKVTSILPVSAEPATKYIERPTEALSNDIRFGELTGTAFQLKGYSYSSDYKDLHNFDNADLLTNVCNMLYQKDVALTQLDLKYLAKESQNTAATFTLIYYALFNEKHSGEMGPASVMNDVTANSGTRREELVKRVASGIESADVEVVDFSAVFEGKQKIEYLLTAALANSYVDNTVQAALFFKGNEQINVVFKMVKPKMAPLNFQEALNNEIKVTYEADLKYGNSENVHLKGFGERSEMYTTLLSYDPMAKQCMAETRNDNLYQMDCHKMIIKAHAPDYFKATVSYNKRSPDEIGMTTIQYNTYKLFKYMYSRNGELYLNTVDDGKMEIEAQAYYYDNYINYEFKSNNTGLRLNNAEGMSYYPYAMAFYAPLSNWERTGNWFTGYQNLPFCSVDGNKVRTFSGRSYNYSLTSSWHVVMSDESHDQLTDLVILARRPSDKQEEVYVSYKIASGKSLELEIKPTAVTVKSNTKKIREGALTTYWDEQSKTPFLEYYSLANGVLLFNINNGALRFMFDSQRLVIFTDNHRSTTRGICGMSTSEARDDYMTPWGLVDLPEHYGASFSLEGEFSDPKTVELKKEAKLKAYQPAVTKYTNILRSDAEWTKANIDLITRSV